MMYLANPCSSAVVDTMTAGQLGFIDTPAQGNRRPPGVVWCADNGCYSDRWDEKKWWKFLVDNAHDADTCLFAVAPDIVADGWRSHMRSYPWLSKIRSLGYPVAYVVQNGSERHPVPWWDFDALFIGGVPECTSCRYTRPADDRKTKHCPRCNRRLTEWKLGAAARALVAEAKRRGKHVHMGRVNSEKRWRYAQAIGCDSVDGTFLTRGADKNLPQLLAWTRNNDQEALFGGFE